VDLEQSRQAAAETLTRYAGTPQDDVTNLVDALCDAANEEALEVLTGGPPPFGSAADARAAKLSRITRHFVRLSAGRKRPARPLSRLEVQALFRVPATGAAGIDRRMRAMWPDIDNQLLATEVVAGIESLTRGGTVQAGYAITIAFQSDSAQRAAETLLERNGLLGLLDTGAPRRKLVMAYGNDKDKRKRIDGVLHDVLGLEPPPV
jgi:hypothetical protein